MKNTVGSYWSRHLAYLWCQSTGKGDDAQSFLKNGLEANPTSFLLNFSFTEHQEQSMLAYQATPGVDSKKVDEKKAEVHETFRKFTNLLKKGLDELEERHLAQGGTQISQQASGTNTKAPVATAAPITVEDDIAMKENEIYGIIDPAVVEAKEREKERVKENERMEAVLIDKRTELGQASIAWLRYAKRAGQSSGMRNTFKEIRADKWVCWQVYEAAGGRFISPPASMTD
jgi:cleavage stimulation factor subunit 3